MNTSTVHNQIKSFLSYSKINGRRLVTFLIFTENPGKIQKNTRKMVVLSK